MKEFDIGVYERIKYNNSKRSSEETSSCSVFDLEICVKVGDS